MRYSNWLVHPVQLFRVLGKSAFRFPPEQMPPDTPWRKIRLRLEQLFALRDSAAPSRRWPAETTDSFPLDSRGPARGIAAAQSAAAHQTWRQVADQLRALWPKLAAQNVSPENS